MTHVTLTNWRPSQTEGVSQANSPPEIWEAALAIGSLETKLRERRDQRQQAQVVPSILYHYTNVSGLQGMLSSYKLWLSDAALMNDPLEGTWVHHRVSSVASDLLESSSLAAQLLTQIDVQLAAPDLWDLSLRGAPPPEDLLSAAFHDATRPAFIASFTEEGDLLSQWRGYGDGGAGVSIGFNLNELGPCVIDDFGRARRPTVIKVEYNVTKQDAEIALILGHIREEYENYANKLSINSYAENWLVDQLLAALREALYWLRWEFKSPYYSEEKEWRLVLNPYEFNAPRQTRVSNGIIVPYVELPLPQRSSRPLNEIAISRIVLGPTCPPTVLRGIRVRLQNLAYPVVEKSQLALR